MVDSRSEDLGERGEQEIRADRRLRGHAKHQNQQRRHEGTPSDSGGTDNDADQQSCDGVG
jgi:hypothetical protein